jgi:hypothetical protein
MYIAAGQRRSSRKGEKQFLILENQGEEVVAGKLRPRKISEVAWLSACQVPDAIASGYIPGADGPHWIRSNPIVNRP